MPAPIFSALDCSVFQSYLPITSRLISRYLSLSLSLSLCGRDLDICTRCKPQLRYQLAHFGPALSCEVSLMSRTGTRALSPVDRGDWLCLSIVSLMPSGIYICPLTRTLSLSPLLTIYLFSYLRYPFSEKLFRVLNLLIDLGADIDVREVGGETPVHQVGYLSLNPSLSL